MMMMIRTSDVERSSHQHQIGKEAGALEEEWS